MNFSYLTCRALQTAAGVFGGDDNVDGSGGLPLMVSNSGNSGRPAISSLNCPTFIASELGRGRIVCHTYYLLAIINTLAV